MLAVGASRNVTVKPFAVVFTKYRTDALAASFAVNAILGIAVNASSNVTVI